MQRKCFRHRAVMQFNHDAGMRIAIATDAWRPQVNGVVTTLSRTRDELVDMGHEVLIISPEGRRSFACPTYPEIRLAFFQGRKIARELDAFCPDSIHVATEGPVGFAARRYCRRRQLPFTTAYHTRFPEYVRARVPIPVSWTRALVRWFHGAAIRTMVPTESMRRHMREHGFRNVVIWSRGVDTEIFNTQQKTDYDLPRPVWINVGRVSVEKNIEAFLGAALPGSKVIVGDGPDRERLQARYPDCYFAGYRFGEDLAAHLAGADVFVFPSRTDTFGLVMLEAMACALPVAAYPVEGPVDVVSNGQNGVLDEDLGKACLAALDLNGDDCRKHAEGCSWRRATEQFASHLEPIVATARLSARRSHP